MKPRNTYFLLRHGEAISNRDSFVSCWPEKTYNPLTQKGINEVKHIAQRLKKEKIDLIFSSDVLRAKQSAEIIAKKLGLKINFDKKLRESKFGKFNDKSAKEWKAFLNTIRSRPPKKSHKEENYLDVRKRIEEFIKKIDKRYKNKKILIISHGAVVFSLLAILKGIDWRRKRRYEEKLKFKNGELKK